MLNAYQQNIQKLHPNHHNIQRPCCISWTTKPYSLPVVPVTLVATPFFNSYSVVSSPSSLIILIIPQKLPFTELRNSPVNLGITSAFTRCSFPCTFFCSISIICSFFILFCGFRFSNLFLLFLFCYSFILDLCNFCDYFELKKLKFLCFVASCFF